MDLLRLASVKGVLDFPENLKAFTETVEAALKQAIKENDMIYVETVPSREKCEPIAGVCLAKIPPCSGSRFVPGVPTPFDTFPTYEETEDMLAEKESSLTDAEAASRRSEATTVKLEANQCFLKVGFASRTSNA